MDATGRSPAGHADACSHAGLHGRGLSLSTRSAGARASGFPTCGEKRRELADSYATRETWQDVRKVFDRVDPNKSAAAQDRKRDRRAITASVRASEEKVLPRESRTDMESFDDAVVHRHFARFKEASQRDVMICQIAKGDTKERCGRFG